MPKRTAHFTSNTAAHAFVAAIRSLGCTVLGIVAFAAVDYTAPSYSQLDNARHTANELGGGVVPHARPPLTR